MQKCLNSIQYDELKRFNESTDNLSSISEGDYSQAPPPVVKINEPLIEPQTNPSDSVYDPLAQPTPLNPEAHTLLSEPETNEIDAQLPAAGSSGESGDGGGGSSSSGVGSTSTSSSAAFPPDIVDIEEKRENSKAQMLDGGTQTDPLEQARKVTAGTSTDPVVATAAKPVEKKSSEVQTLPLHQCKICSGLFFGMKNLAEHKKSSHGKLPRKKRKSDQEVTNSKIKLAKFPTRTNAKPGIKRKQPDDEVHPKTMPTVKFVGEGEETIQDMPDLPNAKKKGRKKSDLQKNDQHGSGGGSTLLNSLEKKRKTKQEKVYNDSVPFTFTHWF